MQNGILCGSYRVFEKTEYLKNDYECAAWWRKINVEQGEYPVHGYLQGSSLHFYAQLNGTIVADNFQSLWGGVAIGKSYDETQNTGKAATYCVFGRDYEVFASMHKEGDHSPWKIDLSTIPYELSTCSGCGGIIQKHPLSTRCPRCSTERQQALQNHIRRRHRFLLVTGYGLRTTLNSSYLDMVISGAYNDQGSLRENYRKDLRAEIAAMRAAGPQGRIAARQKHPVPAYAFVVS
jgi:hypothetical protein